MSCLIEADLDENCLELYCKVIKGRKTWRCGECNTLIHKGQEHEVFVGLLDERINTHRTCSLCLQIRNKFCCNWTFEGVYEDIENAIDADPKIENCILMMASKDEYNKLIVHVHSLEDDEDEDDDDDDDDDDEED